MKQRVTSIIAVLIALGLAACNLPPVTVSVLSTPVSIIPTVTAQPTSTWTPTTTSSPTPTETSTATLTPRPTTIPCPILTPGGTVGQIIFSAVKCYNETCQPFDGDVAPIYLINSDGNGMQQIFEGVGVIGDLQLSPDGTKLAFTDNYGRGISNVYVLDIASGNAWPLVSDDVSQKVWGARWISDNKLVFITISGMNSPEFQSNLYLANADGSQLQQLTDRSPRARIHNVALSPDSMQLLFAEFIFDSDVTTVYRMNVDGTGLRELMTFPGMHAASAAWSPTGDRIVVYPNLLGFAEYVPVYIGQSDGRGMTEIAALPGKNSLDLLGWTEYPYGLLFYLCNHPLGVSRIVEAQNDGSVRTLANVEIPDTPLDTTWCVFGSLSPDQQLFAFAPFLPSGARNLYVTDMLSDDCSYQILSGYSIQNIAWLPNQAVP